MQQENQQLAIDDLHQNVCSSTSNTLNNSMSSNFHVNTKGLPSLQHLLDLPQNCIVTEFNDFGDYMQFCVETIPVKPLCPTCSSIECVIKDYRTHCLHDTPVLSKPSILILEKRRYRCKTCGKKFLENFSFISPNARITKRLEATIRFKLLQIQSIKRISLDLGISTDTVKKIIDSSDIGSSSFIGVTLKTPTNPTGLQVLLGFYYYYHNHYRFHRIVEIFGVCQNMKFHLCFSSN